MAIDRKEMWQQWMIGSLVNVEGTLCIPEEWKYYQQLMMVRESMVQVARSKEDLFRLPDRVRKGRGGIVATRLGRRLELCMGMDYHAIERSFPRHRFDPYFRLFMEVFCASPLWRREYLRKDLTYLKSLVDALRAGAKRKGFMQGVANHKRGSIKNERAVRKYIDDLYGDYAKLLHVRIDLYYDMSTVKPGDLVVEPEVMKAHRERLLRYVRAKYPSAVGHMWTLEFGPMKGPHYHIFLHFDGSKVRNGITIAQQLGEHWRHVITKGAGRYWNVNSQEAGFEKQGRRGIGLISHHDLKRRENLLKAASYLVKVDLFVRVEMPGVTKTFGHGVFRPRKRSNAGRKRKGHKLLKWLDEASKRALLPRRPTMPELPRGI